MKKSYFTVKRTKYNNQSCRCRIGHMHDSIGEAQYCDNLSLLVKVGEIKSFCTQFTFDLILNGKKICGHRVDFVITKNSGKQEVHEYKGFTTEVWNLKRKLFEALYPEIPYIVVWHREPYNIFKKNHV